MKSLVQTILEHKTDTTFIDDIILIAKKKNQEIIADILTHRKQDGLSKTVVDWLLDEHGATLKDIIQSSYHPFIIRYLQQYALKQGIQYWNIAQHPFRYTDMVYDFFSGSKSLYIRKHNIDDLVQRSFSEDTMLLGSSFVLVNQENMYFIFSKIEKKDPDDRGIIQGRVIEKRIMSLERKGLNHVSGYIQDKFPDYNLFELLKIDPEEVL